MDRRALMAGAAAAAASLSVRRSFGQEARQSVFDRVRSTGVLRVAAIVGEEPYFHKDLASGKWSGACVDMAEDIGRTLNAKPQYIESTWSTIVLGLQSGRLDLGFSLSASPDRALAIEFTRPLFIHSFAVLTSKTFNRANTWSDLNQPSVRLAVDIGSTQEIIARRFAGRANISEFKSTTESLLSVAAGHSDAIVIRAALAISAKKKNSALGEIVVPTPVLSMATNMGVPMEPDKRFRDFLSLWADYNRSLGQIREWMVDGYKTIGVTPADIPDAIQF